VSLVLCFVTSSFAIDESIVTSPAAVESSVWLLGSLNAAHACKSMTIVAKETVAMEMLVCLVTAIVSLFLLATVSLCHTDALQLA